ncbi:MAG: flagellar hook-length control protein FliK [Acidobacteria bacterium]|nr:flagellar hook-length control protein FliK [Acidobacteriota bacterium]
MPVSRSSPETAAQGVAAALPFAPRTPLPASGVSQAAEPGAARATAVQTALLEKTPEQQTLQLQIQDEKLGRVVIRLTERAGLIDAMVRTDGTRSRELLGQQLPLLVESLARRGFATRQDSPSSNPDSREGADHNDQPSRREQQPRRQRRDQKARPSFKVRLK